MTEGVFTSTTDNWATPQDLFDELDEEFGFGTDVCASVENHKCANYYTKEQDGLKQNWTGKCFMNPPYGREIGKWVKKAYETARGGVRHCRLPASCENGHYVVADLCAESKGHTIRQGPVEVWEIKQFSTLPECNRGVQEAV